SLCFLSTFVASGQSQLVSHGPSRSVHGIGAGIFIMITSVSPSRKAIESSFSSRSVARGKLGQVRFRSRQISSPESSACSSRATIAMEIGIGLPLRIVTYHSDRTSSHNVQPQHSNICRETLRGANPSTRARDLRESPDPLFSR